jgi:CDP-4-dehydro-6-deoxyglucose reductase, E3
MSLPPSFQTRVLRVRALSPNVRELTLERLDGGPMAFDPGQWVHVFVPRADHESVEKRSYSIASPPDGSGHFDIAVVRVPGGPVSSWLYAAEPGAKLRVSGPQGVFTRLPSDGPPSLLIATGTGVTPMRSMVPAAASRGAHASLWILLGVRHDEDILYADEFEALAREHRSIRFEPTLSQPGEGWKGRRGHVQAHVRALWEELSTENHCTPHAYVCGLHRRVASVRDLLRTDLGLPREQVHSERYD